jgi:hypothetical protein
LPLNGGRLVVGKPTLIQFLVHSDCSFRRVFR